MLGDAPAVQRGFVAAQLELAQRFTVDDVADACVSHGADDDLARLSLLLEPRGEIHGIPGGHRRAAERIAHDDLARLDADARADVDAVSFTSLDRDHAEAVADRHGRTHGALRVVLMSLREAEDRHHRVATELLHGPAAALDLRARELEEVAHDAPDDLRIQALAERR